MAAVSMSSPIPFPSHSQRQLQNATKTPPIALRLGPVGRSNTWLDKMKESGGYDTSGGVAPEAEVAQKEKQPKQYPRIIVKDPTGRTLDTFTTLQEAIYRASWTRKKLGEWPKSSLEWRLPKAPTPSRPDYTRVGFRSVTSLNADIPGHEISRARDVSPITSQIRRLDLVAEVLVEQPTLEIAVDDVAFVAESLNHLPSLPSFSFLRHSILAGRSTYVQIVASILLHQKTLRETDQREAEWAFPGFCSGCRRAGFCYGCSKNPKPHIHEDLPARTGGGFRFWKRDRPRDPQRWKIPTNWRLPSSEEELRNLIEKYGGIGAYEQAMLAARQEMERKKYQTAEDIFLSDSGSRSRSRSSRYQTLQNLGSYPPYVTIVSTDDFEESEGTLHDMYVDVDVDEDEDDGEEEEEEDEEERKARLERRRAKRARKHGVGSYGGSSSTRTRVSSEEAVFYGEGSDRAHVRVDTGFEDGGSETDTTGRKVRISIAETSETDRESRPDRRQSRVSRRSRTRSESEGSKSKKHVESSRLKMPDKEKEAREEEEAKIRKERAKANVPFGKKRKEVLYKAPKFFKVHKSQRRSVVAKDPFSTERELNVPKGGPFQVKKSEKKATQFVDFKKSDRTYEAPKKFEIKKEEKKATSFWKPPVKKETESDKRRKRIYEEDDEARRRRRLKDQSPDSGLDSGIGDKDGQKGDGDGDEDKDKLEELSPEPPVQEVEMPKGPKRREVVKKVRLERKKETPPQTPKLPDPPVFKKRTPPPTPPRTPSPEYVVEPPELPELDLDLPTVPDLPDIVDKRSSKKKEKMKFMVEAPPTLKEAPKKRKSAPKVRILPKVLSRPMKSRPAQAQVTSEDIMDIQDPLDFLAKYCIINPDRLPFYEIIFESAVADQEPRYQKPEEKKEETIEQEPELLEEEGKKKKKRGKSRKSAKEKDREVNPHMFATDRGLYMEKVAMTMEEQHLEKLIYTMDLLHHKMTSYGAQLEEMEEDRIHLIANRAREVFPEVTRPDYVPKKKKGKKGKKGKYSPPPMRLKPHEITDDVIIARLDGSMLTQLTSDQDMKNQEIEMERLKEKINEIEDRVEAIASEKLLTDAFCMNHFFNRQGLQTNNPEEFKRQQSELYNRLHPNPDMEMNLEEVEEALQQINNHLITDKEFFFLYNILNLPGRERINFRLFCIIAALSEKVSQLDPVIRKMINNFNYNALDIKMEKCKELFDMLEADHMPRGGALASSLAVELTAGGLRPEHTNYVLRKFNRENKGIIDFLDFVTYVPLFVEIHKRIINHPLSSDLDL